jgi:NAD(P)-dependent dehydrogenase (short-subunit alcohol dehydrogenase family)/acyl carrier protein
LPLAPITETLLSVVSDKTGYPIEMLELTMSMDADLGIDSIKRVEILSALQERLPAAPVIGPDQMGVLNTLGQIAEFLGQGSGVKGQETACSNLAPCPLPLAPAIALFRSSIVAQPLTTTDQQISLAEGGLIVVTDDGSPFSAELCSCLTAQGHRVALTKVLDILEVLPLDQISGLVLVAPTDGTDDQFLKNGFQLLKQVAPGLKRASREGGALLATVSRLDGAFGCLAGSQIADPLSGGLAGMSKTARHEWPEVSCKAIDLGHFPDQTAAALAVAEELFLCGPVEVGLTGSGRIGLALQDLPALSSGTAPIKQGELVVITGGGRGVTAEAAVSLAKAWQPLLVLLGRSPLPQQEPDWLASLTDEAAIKRAILSHATEKLHPREIEEQYQTTISGRELRETMQNIQAVGGKTLYFAVDIRDSEAVAGLMAELRTEHGPIRGIVHGAGVLADRLIVDKTREQFNQVYSTKVVGLRSLLDATRSDDLRFIALFGSTTGRLGRSGQVDYAVANEVLNKLAQSEARNRANCRSLCINWGPWDGGMVTPALKKVFASEGIGLIPLQAGADLLVAELSNPQGPVEVTVLAGVSGSSLMSSEAPKQSAPLKEALRLTFNVDDFPFISSHVIDNRAVLPMAMIVEWLAHAALHGNPGFRFHGFNDLRICKGVIIDRSSPCTLQLMAGKAKRQDAFYQVPVELVSTQQDGRSQLHARAEIVLANRLPEGLRTIKELPNAPYSQSRAVYDQPYLFHGPDLHGIELVTSCSEKGISAMTKAAPEPASWVKSPLRSHWLTDPLVMDSAFQMMILWSFERFGAGSLPSFAARYRQFHETFPKEGAQVMIRVTNAQSHSAVADIEFVERTSGKLIARLEGYECVIDTSLAQAFRRNQLPQASDAGVAVA